MSIRSWLWVVNIGVHEFPDCRAEEFPETSEVRAKSDDVVIVELLAGLPCEC